MINVQLRQRTNRLIRWMLEDRYDRGLGGPPNNWQHSPRYPTRGHGMGSGHLWYQIYFTNDAYDLMIATHYSDDTEYRNMAAIPAEDFRKLALWYLWRWAWGEWFGLRRWLFYQNLSRYVKAMGWHK